MGNALGNRINKYVTMEELENDFNDLQSKNERYIQRIRTLEEQLTAKDQLMCDIESRLLEKELQCNKSINDLRDEMNVMKNIVMHKEKQIDKYTNTIKNINRLHLQTQEVLKSHLL